jgi:two-component system chemotaxis sensor kinase CheA
MDMSKYRDLFISEAREHVQGMSNCKIAELSHHLEDMMDLVRKSELALSSGVTDVLLEGVDALENMIDAVWQDQSLEDVDISSLLARILNPAEGGVQTTAPGKEGASADPEPGSVKETPAEGPAPDTPPGASHARQELHPFDKDDLKVKFEVAPDSLVPAARAYLAVKKLGSIGEVRQTDPPVEEIKSGNYTGQVAVWIGGVNKDQILNTLQSLAEMGQITVTEPDSETAEPPERAVGMPQPMGQAVVKPRKDQGAASTKTVRISTALLDTFINLVGELIVTKGRLKDLLTGSGSRDVDQVLTRVDHLVSGLHGEVMKVRMMPLETVTQRLPRVVRDLAIKRKKKVSLEVIGADIELDRAILGNAVDHGLEDGEGRKASGKSETGRIVLRAFRERDMVYVEVIDDGRGMNLEAIKAKAVEKGVISADQAKIISDEETVMLVCRPGFSTASEVTDVSGRGVGMDVVQSTVDPFPSRATPVRGRPLHSGCLLQ